jgi:hypothetical protein
MIEPGGSRPVKIASATSSTRRLYKGAKPRDVTFNNFKPRVQSTLLNTYPGIRDTKHTYPHLPEILRFSKAV